MVYVKGGFLTDLGEAAIFTPSRARCTTSRRKAAGTLLMSAWHLHGSLVQRAAATGSGIRPDQLDPRPRVALPGSTACRCLGGRATLVDGHRHPSAGESGPSHQALAA